MDEKEKKPSPERTDRPTGGHGETMRRAPWAHAARRTPRLRAHALQSAKVVSPPRRLNWAINNCVVDVLTNRSWWERGRLYIEPFMRADCRRCPSNLCKSAALAAWCGARAYSRIAYVGDGRNDYCAAASLPDSVSPPICTLWLRIMLSKYISSCTELANVVVAVMPVVATACAWVHYKLRHSSLPS
ncbi:Probable phosphatase phospho1 [Eumeta japonica]|uniref:Probable phosphatase phospho1 n=1 Tax=Eumeta variegata TaxID=151549 RepID=A0A4C1T7J2_EUMVA|nr:Probable phosphatase phospho1 [Eumeta japonica]